MHCRHPVSVSLIIMPEYFSVYSLIERSRYRVDMNQRTLPFLSGQDTVINRYKHSSHTGVGYAPNVDATPSEMSTVYIQSWKNAQICYMACTWSVICSANNWPTAVLHSKASYVAFTRLIQQPHYATWWLSHVYSLALFINWSALGWWWFMWYSHWFWCVCIYQRWSNIVWKAIQTCCSWFDIDVRRYYMRSFFKWYEKDDHMDGFLPQFWQSLID